MEAAERIEGKEVGMSGDIEAFLESRDRLSVLLGGQDHLQRSSRYAEALPVSLKKHLESYS